MSRIEQGTQNTEAVSFDRINERLVRTFRGEPTQRSARRELLRNWADLYSGVEVAGTTVEAPAQLATVLPEQLTSGFDAVDQQITAAQLSETEIAEATEAAQQALAWSTKPENSGRQFNFGFLRTEAMKQVASLLFAVLFMLGTVMTACAAGETNAQDSTNAAGAPTTTIESGNNPIQGGGDENEPTYQTFATFKKDANVRSGAGTNFGVAYTGSQGEMLPVTGATKKDTSGKVWREVIIITEAGKPKVTGWVREDLVTISEQVVEETSGGIGTPEITAEQEAATIAALNAISTTTGIGLVEFMHPGAETVAITTTTGITTEAQLTYYLTRSTTDGANQELVAAIVVLNNEGGQVVLVTAAQDQTPGNGGRTVIGPVVARVDIEGAWVPEQQTGGEVDNGGQEQGETMPAMQAKMLEVMEKNSDVFPKELTEQVKQLPFDENRGCFVVDANRCYFPIKTSSYATDTTLEEGIVWLAEDGSNTMTHSIDGTQIHIGTLQNATVENVQWQYDQAAADAWIELLTKNSGLDIPANVKVKLIIAGDMTQLSSRDGRNPNHLPVGGRRNIESMVIPLDNQFSAQMIKVMDENGKLAELIFVASRYGKETNKNGADVLPSLITNYAYMEMYQTLMDIQEDRKVRDDASFAKGKEFIGKINKLYKKDSSGQYIWLFSGSAK